MKNREKAISDYIDQLNKERKPSQHGAQGNDMEMERLMNTVRRVKSLRQEEALSEGNQEEMRSDLIRKKHYLRRKPVRGAGLLLAAAAVIMLLMAVRIFLPSGGENMVYAMEKAFREVKAYHGVLMVEESNEQGEKLTQAKREVWADDRGNYYVKELEGTAEGVITVNNGEKKWQLRPLENEICLLPAFPDAYRFTFELGQEIEEVKLAQAVKEAGEEVIAGRMAAILEITPDGGDTYRLWVDQETKLPLQRETAMRNAIQYRVTYTSIEFADEIPPALLRYQLPEGYAEENTEEEQVINTIEEAENVVDFLPKVTNRLPEGYTLAKLAVQKKQNTLSFYYTAGDGGKTVVIRQSKAQEEFRADSMAALGRISDNTAELMIKPGANSVRWQEGELEFDVLGNVSFEELLPFLEEMAEGEMVLPASVFPSSGTIASPGDNPEDGKEKGMEPEVKVEVDLPAEENEQKSVDAGHSPWKLDPAMVAQVFASLLLSPEGIEGDYPIAYENIEITENDGRKAVAKINDKNSIASYVYLERLVRKDETGIWTVTGYERAVPE